MFGRINLKDRQKALMEALLPMLELCVKMAGQEYHPLWE